MDPTQQQLANRLNPTPVTLNTPSGAGLFREAGDFGSTLYSLSNDGKSLNQLNLLDPTNGLITQEQKQQAGSAGAASSIALQNLKNIYGIDFNSLASHNIGDIYTTFQRQGLGYNDVNSSYHAPTNNVGFSGLNLNPLSASQNTQTTINNTPNSLAPGVTQTQNNSLYNVSSNPSAPTTALQPGSTDTNSVQALQNYLVSKGFMTQAQVNTGYGIYGPQTTAAVAALQKSLGVDNSSGVGYFGPKTMAALQGAGNPTYTAPTSVNSTNTQGGTPSPFNQPTATPGTASDMGGLNATYQQQLASAEALGPQDQKESDLNQLLQSLNTQEADKSGYQTQQNTANGVDSAQATINSLQATQKQNLDAYNASQLQDQQGQGVTTGVDQRQRDAVTKQYAIRSLATSSLLAAAQGDLANAQLLANKAVAAKFDPIEAKIEAAKANIQLIINDPKTTAEEKARAETIANVQNAHAAAVAQDKANATAVQNIAVDAASYLPNFKPTAQYKTAAQALQAIQTAHDPVAAQTIATQTGLTESVDKFTHISGTANQAPGVFDPATGKFTATGSAGVGSGGTSDTGVITSGKLVVTQNDIAQGAQALKASASQGAEADGKYADPNLYLKMYEHWVVTAGGKASDFFKQYPYSTYINPANTWLAQSISDINNQGSSASSGDQTP